MIVDSCGKFKCGTWWQVESCGQVAFHRTVMVCPTMIVTYVNDVDLFEIIGANVEDHQAGIAARILRKTHVLWIAKSPSSDLFAVVVVIEQDSTIIKRVVHRDGIRVTAIFKRVDPQNFSKRIVLILNVLPVGYSSAGIIVAQRNVKVSVIGVAGQGKRIKG